jgi:STE24 endopeptidase
MEDRPGKAHGLAPMNEDKSTRYQRLRRRAGVLSVLAAALLQFGLLVTGGAIALRDAASGLVMTAGVPGALRPWATVAVFVTVLALAHEVVGFPISCYRGLILERRYGLSRESFDAWMDDYLKASTVALAIAFAGSAVLYGLLRAQPQAWWMSASAVFALAIVAIAHLAPVVLLPIFYRVTPLRRDALQARLHALAARAGARVVGVYEWRLSDRTRRANAALVGLGRTRRILVSDTLLSEYADDEIEAVVAHEIGHHVHHDIWRDMAYELALITVGFFAADRVLRAFGDWARIEGAADVAGLPIILLTLGLVSTLQAPLANAISRRHERRADRFALELTARPSAFVSAMRRLAAQNLAEDDPSPLVLALFHTHPPFRERIASAGVAQAPEVAGTGP